ncbi:MAG: hypothetical protein U0Q18_28320 [Bryobacteraceae bacterium]
MSFNSQEQRAEFDRIGNRLREELEIARERYEEAKIEFARLSGISLELGLRHSDGSHAMAQAVKHLSWATREYSEAVKRFSDFILRDRVPGKDEKL